jgi:hypothetical protein
MEFTMVKVQVNKSENHDSVTITNFTDSQTGEVVITVEEFVKDVQIFDKVRFNGEGGIFHSSYIAGCAVSSGSGYSRVGALTRQKIEDRKFWVKNTTTRIFS